MTTRNASSLPAICGKRSGRFHVLFCGLPINHEGEHERRTGGCVERVALRPGGTVPEAPCHSRPAYLHEGDPLCGRHAYKRELSLVPLAEACGGVFGPLRCERPSGHDGFHHAGRPRRAWLSEGDPRWFYTIKIGLTLEMRSALEHAGFTAPALAPEEHRAAMEMGLLGLINADLAAILDDYRCSRPRTNPGLSAPQQALYQSLAEGARYLTNIEVKSANVLEARGFVVITRRPWQARGQRIWAEIREGGR